jgi:hypothetical protein
MASIFDATAPASTTAQAKITGLNSGYNLATSAIEQGNQGFEEAYRALTSHDPSNNVARAWGAEIWSAPDPGQALVSWYEGQGRGASLQARSRGTGRSPVMSRRSISDRALEGVVGDTGGRWSDDDSEIFRSAFGGR